MVWPDCCYDYQHWSRAVPWSCLRRFLPAADARSGWQGTGGGSVFATAGFLPRPLPIQYRGFPRCLSSSEVQRSSGDGVRELGLVRYVYCCYWKWCLWWWWELWWLWHCGGEYGGGDGCWESCLCFPHSSQLADQNPGWKEKKRFTKLAKFPS